MSAADVKTISKMADMAAIYIDEKNWKSMHLSWMKLSDIWRKLRVWTQMTKNPWSIFWLLKMYSAKMLSLVKI